MTTYNVYPKISSEPSLLTVKIEDDEIRELKTERHDYENILKSLEIDNEFYKKEI